MTFKEFSIISAITSGATIILFLAVGFISPNLSEIKNNIALATTVKPETFTELYFEDHLALPKSVAPNEQQNFSFTIRNLENKTVTYPYEVLVEDASGSASEIVTDKITLKHGEQRLVTEWFVILQPVSRAKVIVNLIDKKQQIHFWIGEENK